jgi:hypothetical protein
MHMYISHYIYFGFTAPLLVIQIFIRQIDTIKFYKCSDSHAEKKCQQKDMTSHPL